MGPASRLNPPYGRNPFHQGSFSSRRETCPPRGLRLLPEETSPPEWVPLRASTLRTGEILFIKDLFPLEGKLVLPGVYVSSRRKRLLLNGSRFAPQPSVREKSFSSRIFFLSKGNLSSPGETSPPGGNVSS